MRSLDFAPTLHLHVMKILGLRSEKQVIAAHTVPNITSVTNTQTIADRTVLEFIRETMRSEVSPLNSQEAIPVLHRGPGPEPARFGLVDFGPESLITVMVRQKLIRTLARTKLTGMCFESAGRHEKDRIACFANTLNSTGRAVIMTLHWSCLLQRDDKGAVPGAMTVAARLSLVPNYTPQGA
jgi:hypothetical protein